jgi:hypothetical protein
MMNPERWAERAKQDWRHDPPEWAAKLESMPTVKLPSKIVLAAGHVLRVPVHAGRGVLVDISYHNGNARVDTLPMSKGEAVDLTKERALTQPGVHLIVTEPAVGRPSVTEVLVWLEEGTALVEAWPIVKDGKGRVRYPCAHGLGEAPLESQLNCGPTETLKFSRQVKSVADAIEVMRDPRVAEFYQWHGDLIVDWKTLPKRVRVRKLGKRTLYEWMFEVRHCGPDTHWFRVTSDGWVGVYGCCGK